MAKFETKLGQGRISHIQDIFSQKWSTLSNSVHISEFILFIPILCIPICKNMRKKHKMIYIIFRCSWVRFDRVLMGINMPCLYPSILPTEAVSWQHI